MVMSLLYYRYGSMQVGGVIHGEKSMGVGSDGMIGMVLSFTYYATGSTPHRSTQLYPPPGTQVQTQTPPDLDRLPIRYNDSLGGCFAIL